MSPEEAGEAATLQGFLSFQRATLAWKCRGLSDEQLRAALPPTSMTLGGMLKHLAYVEDLWFTQVVAGEPLPEPWASADFTADPDWEWTTAAPDSGDELRALWAQRVDRSDAIVAARLGQGEAAALSQAYSAWGAGPRQPPLDPGAHDRGVRPPQRPRRPAPPVHRRGDR